MPTGRVFVLAMGLLWISGTAFAAPGTDDTPRAPTAPAAPTAAAAPVGAERARAEALFLARGQDAKKLEEAVALFEAEKAWSRAARACYQRIDLHEDLASDDDARERWIDRGLAAGCKALAAEDVDEVVERLPALTRADVEPLYWLTGLYGRKITLVNALRRATMVSTFRKLLERAAALDGVFHHAGPRRMLGDFLCSAPGFMGGDFERGAREVDAAIAGAPLFLETYVLRAKKVRVERKDRAGFKADLQRVLDASEGALPDVVPEQRDAKKTAKALLAREAELFD